ncbi:MAG: tetraacyldisaccharide 4'-kinase [Rhizobiaceae bacterium]
MASEAPPFWWSRPDWRAWSLWPFAKLYGFVAGQRMLRAPREKIDVPVLCIGNFTVGGSGKTPVAIAFARQARRMKLKPGILSRGYGGSAGHARLVDPAHDLAKHVGDEPLLLAEHALVAVCADRAAGARLLLGQGCDFLIMDDGFQSAKIHIDYALIVVDGRYGLGNGHVIPAGPLRAPLVHQMRFATALLRLGKGSDGDTAVRRASRAGRPVFLASIRTRAAERFAGRRFLAFAGIGHPEKFFATIEAAGGTVAARRPFADHHFFAPDELADLSSAAERDGLELITTAKDAARLRHGAASPEFLARLNVLDIEAVFDDASAPSRIIEETRASWKRRRLES